MFDKLIDAVAQPFVDAADVFDGLCEGEFRVKPAARLAADVVLAAAAAEAVDVVSDLLDSD